MAELTDEQWNILEPFFKPKDLMRGFNGRPRHNARSVLEGILWVLRTGAQWRDLPDRFPSYQTCHRRFQEWARNGLMEQILESLAEDLEKRGGLDLTETFIDGSFAAAKKGDQPWVKPRKGKEPKSWALRTAMVFLSPYVSIVPRHMKSH